MLSKENRRALKKQGAIVVSNHISFLDTLFVRAAAGQYRSFHTMAPWNNKTGVGGWFMRHAGMWAFSANLAATKNLMLDVGYDYVDLGYFETKATLRAGSDAVWNARREDAASHEFHIGLRYNF